MSKVAAIILAAGRSQRMGQQKLLLPWANQTVIEAVLETVCASTIDEICLVIGAETEKIPSLAKAYPVKIVHNPDFSEGEILSSLKTGLKTLAQDYQATLVFLADMPRMSQATIETVLAARREGYNLVPIFEGQRGHPVCFDKQYWQEILDLPTNSRPAEILRRHPQALIELALDDDAVISDIDTPEAYERELEKMQAKS